MFFYVDAGKAWQKCILVALPALVVIPSLIIERKHYSLFYKSPYREIIVESGNAAEKLGRSNCFMLIDSHRRFTDYYLGKPGMEGFRVNYIHDAFDPAVLGSILDTCKSRYFVYGCISNSAWEDYAIISSKYPFVISHRCFNEGDVYVFSTDSSKALKEYYFSSYADFIANNSGWENFRKESTWFSGVDLQTPVYCMDSGMQFSPLFRGPLRDICRHKNDIIDLCAEVATFDGFSEAYLQLGIYQNQELLKFQSVTIKGIQPGGYRRVYCTCRLADIEWRHHGLVVKAFIWNPGKQQLLIRGMNFRIRPGNPYLYGLYRRIDH